MDVDEKLDVLLERTARLDEKQDALKASVDELKATFAAHAVKDDTHFESIEKDLNRYKGAVKLAGALVSFLMLPKVWTLVLGVFGK